MNISAILILSLLLIIVAYYDYKHYRIKNALIGLGGLIGIALNISLPGGIGFSNALMGLGLGLVTMLPFYFLRIMGAGDVKLIAMVGAFMGPTSLIPALFYILISGGVMALVVMMCRDGLRTSLEKLRINLYRSLGWLPAMPTDQQALVTTDTENTQASLNHAAHQRLPYAIAIAAGTLLFLLQTHLWL